MAVKFEDFSFEVKAALDETTTSWLYTWSEEIASQARTDCAMDGNAGDQLRGSYKNDVNETQGEAKIGSPLEQAYWEEWGTGSHAAHKNGRKGWWVYVKDGPRGNGGKTYSSQKEAESIAASMRADGLQAFATNGREPNYTLERAFDRVKPKAIKDLEKKLKEKMGK